MNMPKILAIAALCLASATAFAGKTKEYEFRIVVMDKKEQIDEVIKLLGQGTSFKELASTFNHDDKLSRDGGLMSATADDTFAEVIDVVSKLSPGETSKIPHQTKVGWFVAQLVKVTLVDDREETQRKEKAFAEKIAKEESASMQAEQDYERATLQFASCARRAVALENKQDNFKKRVDMRNMGLDIPVNELSATQRELRQMQGTFNADCGRIRYNEDIVKACDHPAMGSKWCERAKRGLP